MEEILIYKVQEKRVLYDINLAHYKDNKARTQAWEEIATELGLKAIECRDMWCKLRNSYNNARKRRLKHGHALLGKWKYEDQMSFVIPFLGTSCEGGNWASQKYKLLDSPTRKDINYTIDETVIDATGSDDDEVFEADVRSNTITSSRVFTLSSRNSNNHEQLRNWESLSENKTSLGKIMAHIKPMSPDKINNFHSNTVSYIPPSKESLILEEDDACANHSATFHGNSEVGSETISSEFERRTDKDRRMNDDKSTLTIVIKKPNSSNSNYNQDECVEEEYYLRLARMARKLKPPDRIKLRETVSSIVIDALINSLPED